MAEPVRDLHIHQPPNRRRFVIRVVALLFFASGSRGMARITSGDSHMSLYYLK
jgi:hypothetical protein